MSSNISSCLKRNVSPVADLAAPSSPATKKANNGDTENSATNRIINKIILSESNPLLRSFQLTTYIQDGSFSVRFKHFEECHIDKRVFTAFIAMIPFIKQETIVENIKNSIPRETCVDTHELIVGQYVKYYTNSDPFKTYSFADLARNIEQWLFDLPTGQETSLLFEKLCKNDVLFTLLTKNCLFYGKDPESAYTICLKHMLMLPDGIYIIQKTLRTFARKQTESTHFFRGLQQALEQLPRKDYFLLRLFPIFVVTHSKFIELLQSHDFNTVPELLAECRHLDNTLRFNLQGDLGLVLSAARLVPEPSLLSKKIEWMTFFYRDVDSFAAHLIHLSDNDFLDLLKACSLLESTNAVKVILFLTDVVLPYAYHKRGPHLLDIFMEALNPDLIKQVFMHKLSRMRKRVKQKSMDRDESFFIYLALIKTTSVQNKVLEVVRTALSEQKRFFLMRFYEMHLDVFQGELPYIVVTH